MGVRGGAGMFDYAGLRLAEAVPLLQTWLWLSFPSPL